MVATCKILGLRMLMLWYFLPAVISVNGQLQGTYIRVNLRQVNTHLHKYVQ